MIGSSQESIAEEFYAALRIKTHLDNTVYIGSLCSDLSCAAELVIAGAPAGLLQASIILFLVLITVFLSQLIFGHFYHFVVFEAQ